MSVIEFLTNNSGILGLAVSVISIVFAVFVWMNGKRKKEFTYAKTTFQLVSEGVSSVNRLKLLFDDAQIQDLSVTRFTIWNSGTEEIEQEDLYKKEPLRIINSGNAQILDASIIPESDEKHKFKLSLNEEKDVKVDFECAEKQDGVVIQVLHSGNADELKPTIGIKGGEELQTSQNDSIKKRNSKTIRKEHTIIFGLLGCSILFIFVLMISFFSGEFIRSSSMLKAYQESIQAEQHDINEEISCIIPLEREYLESLDLQKAICVLGIIFSIIGCLTILILYMIYVREVYYFFVPPKLRKYVQVEITS